jgi:hypothetical protein
MPTATLYPCPGGFKVYVNNLWRAHVEVDLWRTRNGFQARRPGAVRDQVAKLRGMRAAAAIFGEGS